MTDITKLLELKDNAIKLNQEVSLLSSKAKEAWMLLQQTCTHPTTTSTREYFSGSYYDRSSVTITVKCSICDKVLQSYDDPNHVGYHG